jgi:hypothetical protein
MCTRKSMLCNPKHARPPLVALAQRTTPAQTAAPALLSRPPLPRHRNFPRALRRRPTRGRAAAGRRRGPVAGAAAGAGARALARGRDLAAAQLLLKFLLPPLPPSNCLAALARGRWGVAVGAAAKLAKQVGLRGGRRVFLDCTACAERLNRRAGYLVTLICCVPDMFGLAVVLSRKNDMRKPCDTSA